MFISDQPCPSHRLHSDPGGGSPGPAALDTGQPCVWVCGLHWPQGFRRVSAWREPCPGFPQKGGIASPTCFPRVLWGGQELGLTGSARWEQRHRELSRARAGLPGVLSAPTGAGKQPVLRSSWGFPGAGQPGRSLQAGAGTALPLPWL